MSELKVLLATPHPKMKNACDGAVEVYLKSDADKVIAELKKERDWLAKERGFIRIPRRQQNPRP